MSYRRSSSRTGKRGHRIVDDPDLRWMARGRGSCRRGNRHPKRRRPARPASPFPGGIRRPRRSRRNRRRTRIAPEARPERGFVGSYSYHFTTRKPPVPADSPIHWCGGKPHQCDNVRDHGKGTEDGFAPPLQITEPLGRYPEWYRRMQRSGVADAQPASRGAITCPS
jgi:hypothetical protein